MPNQKNQASANGIKIDELPRGIVHLKFPSQQLLASTFLRFQEHFESPKFKGKIFSLQEFVDWYTSVRGKFDYYEEWDGFNLPSEGLNAFIDGKFDPLSKEEQELLSLFRARKGEFYIIGTLDGGDPDTLKHEIAHALFYLNLKYRKEASRILKQFDLKEIAQHLLSTLGYHDDVLEDELHAYLLAELEYLEEEGFHTTKYEDVHHKLNELFEQHFKIEHFGRGH